MIKSSYAKARMHALSFCDEQLDGNFVYHNRRHTLDVTLAVRRLAFRAEVSQSDRLLLETAALFHDLGLAFNRENHESASAALCQHLLADFAYSPEEIECIASMILATRLPQNPRTLLEALLCDADLDCLGRRDYLKISGRLRQERDLFGIRCTDEEWLNGEIEFLSRHQYHTDYAKHLRDQGKLRNLERLLKMFSNYELSKGISAGAFDRS